MPSWPMVRCTAGAREGHPEKLYGALINALLLLLIGAHACKPVYGANPGGAPLVPMVNASSRYFLSIDANDRTVLHVNLNYEHCSKAELIASSQSSWNFDTASGSFQTSGKVKYRGNQGALPNVVLSDQGATIGVGADGNLTVIGNCGEQDGKKVLACPLSALLPVRFPLLALGFPAISELGVVGTELEQIKLGIWYDKQKGSAGFGGVLDYGYRSSNVLLAGGACANMPWTSNRIFNHYKLGTGGAGLEDFKFLFSFPGLDCNTFKAALPGPGGDFFDDSCMPKLPTSCPVIKEAVNAAFGSDAANFLGSTCSIDINIDVPSGCDLLRSALAGAKIEPDNFFAAGTCKLLSPCQMVAKLGGPKDFTDGDCKVGCATAGAIMKKEAPALTPYFEDCRLKPACALANSLASDAKVQEEFAAVFDTDTCHVHPVCPLIQDVLGGSFGVLFNPDCSLKGPCAIFKSAAGGAAASVLFNDTTCALQSPCHLLKRALDPTKLGPLLNDTCALPSACNVLHASVGTRGDVDTFLTPQCKPRPACDVLQKAIGDTTYNVLFQEEGRCVPRTPCDTFLHYAPPWVSAFFDGGCNFLSPCAFLKVALGNAEFARFFPKGDCALPSLCGYVRQQLPSAAAAFLDENCGLTPGCELVKRVLGRGAYKELHFVDDHCTLPQACDLAKAVAPEFALLMDSNCSPLPACTLIRELLRGIALDPDQIFSPRGSCEISLGINCPNFLQKVGPGLTGLFNATTCQLLPLTHCDILALVPGSPALFDFARADCPLKTACQILRPELPPGVTGFFNEACDFEPLCPILQEQFPAVSPLLDADTCQTRLPSACDLIKAAVGSRMEPYLDSSCRLAPGCAVIKSLLSPQEYGQVFADNQCGLPTACAALNQLFPASGALLQADCSLKPACVLARAVLGDELRPVVDTYFHPDCTLKVPGACAVARAALGPVGMAVFTETCELPGACAVFKLLPESSNVYEFEADGTCRPKTACALVKSTLPGSVTDLLGPDCSIGPLCPVVRSQLPAIAPFLKPGTCALEPISPCALLRAALPSEALGVLFPGGGCELVSLCGLLKQTPTGRFLDETCSVLPPCTLAFAVLGEEALSRVLNPDCSLKLGCPQVLAALGPEAETILNPQCKLKTSCAILSAVPGTDTVLSFRSDGSCGIRDIPSPCAFAQIALSKAGLTEVFADSSCSLRTPCELLKGSDVGKQLAPFLAPNCALKPPCGAVKALISREEYDAVFVDQTCGLPSPCGVLRALVTPSVADAWLQPNCTIMSSCALAFHHVGAPLMSTLFTTDCHLRYNVTCPMVAAAMGPAGALFFDTANGCALKTRCEIIEASPLAPYFDWTNPQECPLKSACTLLRPSLPRALVPFFTTTCAFYPTCQLLLQSAPAARAFLEPDCGLKGTCQIIRPLLPDYVAHLLHNISNCSFLPTCSDLLSLEPRLSMVLNRDCSVKSPCAAVLSELPTETARLLTPDCRLRPLCEVLLQNATLGPLLNADCSLKSACEIAATLPVPQAIANSVKLFYDTKTCQLKDVCQVARADQAVAQFLQPDCSLEPACSLALKVPEASRFLDPECRIQNACHVAFNGRVPSTLQAVLSDNCTLKSGCQILKSVGPPGVETFLDKDCNLGSACSLLTSAPGLSEFLNPGCDLKSPCQILMARGGPLGHAFEENGGNCTLKSPCTIFKAVVGPKLGPLMDDQCNFHLPGLSLGSIPLPGIDLTPALSGSQDVCVMIDACEPTRNWGASFRNPLVLPIDLPYGLRLEFKGFAFSYDGLMEAKTTQKVFDGYTLREVPNFPVQIWAEGGLNWNSKNAMKSSGKTKSADKEEATEPPFTLNVDAQANLSIGWSGKLHGGMLVLNQQVIKVSINFKKKSHLLLAFEAGPTGTAAAILGERASNHAEDCDLRGFFFTLQTQPPSLAQFIPALKTILSDTGPQDTIALALNTDGPDDDLQVKGFTASFKHSLHLWKKFDIELGVRYRSASEKLRRQHAQCPDDAKLDYQLPNCEDGVEIWAKMDDFDFLGIIKVGGPQFFVGIKTDSTAAVECSGALTEDVVIHIKVPSIYVLGISASTEINIREGSEGFLYSFTAEGDFYDMLDAVCTFLGTESDGDVDFGTPSCDFSLGPILKAIGALAEKTWDEIAPFVDDVASSVATEAHDVEEFFDNDVKHFFDTTFKEGMEDVGKAFEDVGNFLEHGAEAAACTVKDAFERGFNFNSWKDELEKAANAVANAFKSIGGWFSRRRALLSLADAATSPSIAGSLPQGLRPPTLDEKIFYCSSPECDSIAKGTSDDKVGDAVEKCKASCEARLNQLAANHATYLQKADLLNKRPTVQDIQDCRLDDSCSAKFLPSSPSKAATDFPGLTLHELNETYTKGIYPHMGPIQHAKFPPPSTYGEVKSRQQPFGEVGLNTTTTNASLTLHLKNVGTESRPRYEVDLEASKKAIEDSGKQFAQAALTEYPWHQCNRTRADLSRIPDGLDNDCDGVFDNRFFNRYSTSYLKQSNSSYEPDPWEDFACPQTTWTPQSLSTPRIREMLCPTLVRADGSFIVPLEDVVIGRLTAPRPDVGPDPSPEPVAQNCVVNHSDSCQLTPQVWASTKVVQVDGACAKFAATKTWNARDACGGWVDPLQQTIVYSHEGPVPAFPLPVVRQYCNISINPAITGWQFAAVVDPLPNEKCNFKLVKAQNYSDVQVSDTCQLRVTKRTFVMVDSCGRSATYTAEIQQYDDKGPDFISFPADVTVAWGDPYGPVVTGRPLIKDDCHDPMTLTFADRVLVPDLTCPGDKLIERSWIATDGCGNKNSRIQRITVQVQSGFFGEASLYQIVALQDGISIKGTKEEPVKVWGQIAARGNIDVVNAEVGWGTCAYSPYSLVTAASISDKGGLSVNSATGAMFGKDFKPARGSNFQGSLDKKSGIDWKRLQLSLLDLSKRLPSESRYGRLLDGEAAYFTYTSQNPSNMTVTRFLNDTGVGVIIRDLATNSITLRGTNPLFNVFNTLSMDGDRLIVTPRMKKQPPPTINIDVPPFSVALVNVARNTDTGGILATVNLLNGTSDGLLWNLFQVDNPDTGVAFLAPLKVPRVFPGTILAPNGAFGLSTAAGQALEGQLIASQVELQHTQILCGHFQGAHMCRERSLEQPHLASVTEAQSAPEKNPRDELRKKFRKRKALSIEEV